MRVRPHGSSSNFQRQLSIERDAWNERAKRSRIFSSSPASKLRITTSTGMRRFCGADGARVDRWAGAAARAEARPARGEPMAEELVIAVFEIRNDGLDLEAGVLQQLDQRGARIEDQMGAEVVHHPLPLGEQVEKAFGVEGGEEERSARFQQVLYAAKCIVRLGHVFEDMEERDRKSTRLNSSHGYISYAV